MSDDRSLMHLSRDAIEAFCTRHAGGERASAFEAGLPVRVERLDWPGAYLLVPVRDGSGLRGIVQFDAVRLSVESTAAIRDPGAAFLTSGDAALAAARAALPGGATWGTPFLGWRPCRESADSMQPLWVIPHRGGHVYVSQSGRVFEELSSGRGG